MRVLCRHGHFSFYPKTPDDIGLFNRVFDVELEPDSDFWTFPFLVDAPRYSLTVKPWLGVPAIATYEGRGPWEVMRENDFVYNISLGLVVPKLTIVQTVELPGSGYYFRAPAQLIQPGARDGSGQQVLSYDAEFEQGYQRLKVLGYDYE